MHLKSISLKGFKSFPDRTKLEFGEGISVIVGPNGSGKSNITDAVLWALGEQSALAVRGQTMQDVIFAGADGIKSRNAAEVEVVIDNSHGRLRSEFSEIAISRRLDRSGEGGYTLNGARCRLVDVIEVLSDSGLGKEMHSVISQGRVEGIIHSKPVDRTTLIEEAAGLSKHRKRRRRAQLKLQRTQDNLDRALDVEREARSHLRPLKRQAEAAELHARLERQSLEARGSLTRESLREATGELAGAEAAAAEARRRRDQLDEEQGRVAKRREETERRLAAHGRERDAISSQLFSVRSAGERLDLRLEAVRGIAATLEARLERAERAIEAAGEAGDAPAESARIAELQGELRALDEALDDQLAEELSGLDRDRVAGEARAAEAAARIETAERSLEELERAAEEGRARLRDSRAQAEAAGRSHTALVAEREALEARVTRGAAAPGGASLSAGIEIDDGLEAAVTAALGGRMTARVVDDVRAGVDAAIRSEGAPVRALVRPARRTGRLPAPPTRDAVRLLDRIRCSEEVRSVCELLLADAWLVGDLTQVPDDFDGIAVTRAGIAYRGRSREVRRLGDTAGERLLADRRRLAEIDSELGEALAAVEATRRDCDDLARRAEERERERERSELELRSLRREREEALEDARRAAWLAGRRREVGAAPQAERRARFEAELDAERRLAERASRERAERAERARRLSALAERDRKLLPQAAALAATLERALETVRARSAELEEKLAADEAVGEETAAELRRLAGSEYELQAKLREAAELLTAEEVRVAQARDRAAAVRSELEGISARLGYALEESTEPLPADEKAELEARLERLERRRERLGPVNPLAESEYQQAVEHVEELEHQRQDLEAALAELEGLIKETDRRIRESFDQTFEAAARNFEDVVRHLFPGGRGKLRLVQPQRPRAVLGGAETEAGVAEDPGSDAGEAAEAEDEGPRDETPGIEIEVTPAGKSTKRLSLLSGGEKSLVALAFLFAVFLARPCPFYILDEVEAALDDVNIDRFLALVRGYSERSQFIVITHQRRTMGAADVLYGVSMGGDGVSKVVSRRLPPNEAAPAEAPVAASEAA